MKKGVRLFIAVSAILSVFALTGCKAQKQMQQHITDLDAKTADTQRRLSGLEAENKRLDGEVNQLKNLISKMGNVVVELQKNEEERQKMAAEARARAAAAAAKGAKKGAGKKKH